jgi:hypothetical protein
VGVVNFDPDAWLLRNDTRNEPAKVAKAAKVGSEQTQILATLAGLASTTLPNSMTYGLIQLERMPAPRGATPEVWREVVSDAIRLRDDGWAAQALALGWEPIHLWGWSPDRDGLAVMLRERRIALIDEASAIIDDGGKSRVYYWARPMPAAKLLWEWR